MIILNEKIEDVNILELLDLRDYNYRIIKEIIRFLKKNKVKINPVKKNRKVDITKYIKIYTHEYISNHKIVIKIRIKENILTIIIGLKSVEIDKKYLLVINKTTKFKEVLEFILKSFLDFKKTFSEKLKTEKDIEEYEEWLYRDKNNYYNLESIEYKYIKIIPEKFLGATHVYIRLKKDKDFIVFNNIVDLVEKKSSLTKHPLTHREKDDLVLLFFNYFLLEILKKLIIIKDEVLKEIRKGLNEISKNGLVFYNYEDIQKEEPISKKTIYNIYTRYKDIDLYSFNLIDKNKINRIIRTRKNEIDNIYMTPEELFMVIRRSIFEKTKLSFIDNIKEKLKDERYGRIKRSFIVSII